MYKGQVNPVQDQNNWCSVKHTVIFLSSLILPSLNKSRTLQIWQNNVFNRMVLTNKISHQRKWR